MGYRIDPRMPAPEACIQRYMLDRWAETQPDKTFAIFADGSEWTYRQTRDMAAATANALRALGVRQGERVLIWLPNSADCLRVWFGLNYLGAVFVPINLAYRGRRVGSPSRHRPRRPAPAPRRGRPEGLARDRRARR